jgi:hypothetical protein
MPPKKPPRKRRSSSITQNSKPKNKHNNNSNTPSIASFFKPITSSLSRGEEIVDVESIKKEAEDSPNKKQKKTPSPPPQPSSVYNIFRSPTHLHDPTKQILAIPSFIFTEEVLKKPEVQGFIRIISGEKVSFKEEPFTYFYFTKPDSVEWIRYAETLLKMLGDWWEKPPQTGTSTTRGKRDEDDDEEEQQRLVDESGQPVELKRPLPPTPPRIPARTLLDQEEVTHLLPIPRNLHEKKPAHELFWNALPDYESCVQGSKPFVQSTVTLDIPVRFYENFISQQSRSEDQSKSPYEKRPIKMRKVFLVAPTTFFNEHAPEVRFQTEANGPFVGTVDEKEIVLCKTLRILFQAHRCFHNFVFAPKHNFDDTNTDQTYEVSNQENVITIEMSFQWKIFPVQDKLAPLKNPVIRDALHNLMIFHLQKSETDLHKQLAQYQGNPNKKKKKKAATPAPDKWKRLLRPIDTAESQLSDIHRQLEEKREKPEEETYPGDHPFPNIVDSSQFRLPINAKKMCEISPVVPLPLPQGFLTGTDTPPTPIRSDDSSFVCDDDAQDNDDNDNDNDNDGVGEDVFAEYDDLFLQSGDSSLPSDLAEDQVLTFRD